MKHPFRLYLAASLAISSGGALSCTGNAPAAKVTTVSSALYVRTDTNDITVWSPRVRAVGRVSEAVELESAYTMDAWSGASIDVVTAATRAIHEVRHELTAGARYELDDVTLGGSYRYSTEPDYVSHGGVGSASVDLAENNTTLALFLAGSRDQVGRAGDPAFQRAQRNLAARLSLTQILDTHSLVQLSWETALVHGYQASPYRFVAIGGSGICAGDAPECVPEQVPADRVRHALVARARRALGKEFSAGLEYRYYFDSWGLGSQTLAPDLRWLAGEHGTLTLGYRYYTQGEADFYRPRYFDRTSSRGYFTRDRELSALYSHRLGLEYLHGFELGRGAMTLTTALRAGVARFRYMAFVGLSRVDALESTLLLGLAFR